MEIRDNVPDPSIYDYLDDARTSIWEESQQETDYLFNAINEKQREPVRTERIVRPQTYIDLEPVKPSIWQRIRQKISARNVFVALLAAFVVTSFAAPCVQAQNRSVVETNEPVRVVYEMDEPISAFPSEETSLIRTVSGNVYTDEVPMSQGYQCTMQDACRRYGVDYALALGIAEVESHFDFEADSGYARGIMQINPINYDMLRTVGIEPETKSGNIQAGVYMIGNLLDRYGDVHKALMAYNCGETGASELWAEGYESSQYSRDVLKAARKWDKVINS